MKTELSFANLAGIETELLAVLAADTQNSKAADAKPKPVLLTTDEAVKTAAAAVLASGEYKAGPNETVLVHAPAGLAAKRLLIVGLGKEGQATVHGVRSAAGTAVRFTKPRGIRELVFALPQPAAPAPVPEPTPAPAEPEVVAAVAEPAPPQPAAAFDLPEHSLVLPEPEPAPP